MAFHYSDDPVRDAERYAADQDRELDRLPTCTDRGYPIQSEHLFLINDELICPKCMADNYRKNTEDFTV